MVQHGNEANYFLDGSLIRLSKEEFWASIGKAEKKEFCFDEIDFILVFKLEVGVRLSYGRLRFRIKNGCRPVTLQ